MPEQGFIAIDLPSLSYSHVYVLYKMVNLLHIVNLGVSKIISISQLYKLIVCKEPLHLVRQCTTTQG